ncbi:hypothetical protein MKW94_017800 [Papaver nudicaule]|uniref:Bet v I/Major latex protein domain-containing protein n=1 Tax=Papaver nudicaule TaxID=74823 RepID=A0AA41S668_PAPNU|nr:hypothetical protein [Papaver nudicaule]
MAQIHRLHVQEELKNCSADQFYGFITNDMAKMPQLIPHMFKSFEILSGDGKSVGTVRLSKYAIGSSRHGEIVKDKIKAVDDENRVLSISVIDGDVLRMYPKWEYTMTVTPMAAQGGEQSCLVKLSVEYEKRSEDVPAPNEYMKMATFMNKAIASHLGLANK